MRYGLSYGFMSARRRIGDMVLPIVTTATGAFLVTMVFAMAAGITAQSSVMGHADEINRAVLLIAIMVLLVGVVEVAVATTRTIADRTREIGVLGANGIRRTPVVSALMVEPVVVAVIGAILGAILGAVAAIAFAATGLAAAGISYSGLALGAALAVAISFVAAIVTSIVPTWNAASRPPIQSLLSGS